MPVWAFIKAICTEEISHCAILATHEFWGCNLSHILPEEPKFANFLYIVAVGCLK